MYKSITIIFSSLIFCIANVYAQDHQCGGVVGDAEAFNQRLRQNIKSAKLNNYEKSSQETVYIPIKFHLVAETDGTGRIDFNSVFDEICILNSQFEALGIVFYLQDGFNLLNHTPTYESPRTAGAAARMIQEKNRVGSEAVNVFITQNGDTGNSDNGTTLGYYDRK